MSYIATIQPHTHVTSLSFGSHQTPAERVRARIKALLDKSSISTATDNKEEEETGAASFVPSPSQLQAIESDSFVAASFVSHRSADKVCWGLKIVISIHHNIRICDCFFFSFPFQSM